MQFFNRLYFCNALLKLSAGKKKEKIKEEKKKEKEKKGRKKKERKKKNLSVFFNIISFSSS